MINLAANQGMKGKNIHILYLSIGKDEKNGKSKLLYRVDNHYCKTTDFLRSNMVKFPETVDL